LRPKGVHGFQYVVCHSFSKAKNCGFHNASEIWGNFPDHIYETVDASGLANHEFSYRCVVEMGQPYLWSKAPQYFHLMTPKERECDLLYEQLALAVGVSFAVWRTRYWGSGVSLWAPHLSADCFEQLWQCESQEIERLSFDFDIAMRRIAVADRFQLTMRECDVLAFMAGGMTPLQVADHLNLSHRTIEGALSRARKRLRVQNTTEAVAKAFVFQLI
jgi:DNA-binding CsgD family transcriptional regulator